MSVSTNKFDYIVSGKDAINLTSAGEKHIRPLLWNRNGIYRIVPASRIKNDLEHTGKANTLIYWFSGIQISPIFARLIIGDDVDSECNYRTKGSTPSS